MKPATTRWLAFTVFLSLLLICGFLNWGGASGKVRYWQIGPFGNGDKAHSCIIQIHQVLYAFKVCRMPRLPCSTVELMDPDFYIRDAFDHSDMRIPSRMPSLIDPWGRPFVIEFERQGGPLTKLDGATEFDFEVKVRSVGVNGRDENGKGDDIAFRGLSIIIVDPPG